MNVTNVGTDYCLKKNYKADFMKKKKVPFPYLTS